MKHLLIRHQVADFAEWKKVYDTEATINQDAGLTEMHVFQSLEDPNEVVLLFAIADLDKAKARMSSPELRATMQNAGVLGQPEVCFLE